MIVLGRRASSQRWPHGFHVTYISQEIFDSSTLLSGRANCASLTSVAVMRALVSGVFSPIGKIVRSAICAGTSG